MQYKILIIIIIHQIFIYNLTNDFNRFPLENNYRNGQMIEFPREFYDSRAIQNQNHFQHNTNPNHSNFRYTRIKPNAPFSRYDNFLIRDNFRKKGITKYI